MQTTSVAKYVLLAVNGTDSHESITEEIVNPRIALSVEFRLPSIFQSIISSQQKSSLIEMIFAVFIWKDG